MSKSLQFLSGGGQMGALIRAYKWEFSPVGSADTWPQSLRTTLNILLNSKFPMFLFWGPHLVCFYNDAYRFSLGNDGKHPLLLGMKGEEAWPETWPIVKPSIDQVLTEHEATWSEDQLIPLYREGIMQDAYWTFSFSPVKDESENTAGVLITCIETTEKVTNLKKLKETVDHLAFAIEATELGTFDFNPLTNKFNGNNRLKDWFGLPHDREVDLTLAIDVMLEKDRSRVAAAIQKTLLGESGGLYDIEYGIINAVTKQERVIRAKGRAWFGDDKVAYRFTGTLQDITEQVSARIKIEVSEAKFRNLILQAPVLITTFIDPSFIVETINKTALEIWGKPYEDVINRPLFESSPELEGSVKTMLDDVYTTGEPFIANEIPIQLKRKGRKDTVYLNTVYQPLRDLGNHICGIIVVGIEVTETVNARHIVEADEKRSEVAHKSLHDFFTQAPAMLAILKGPDHLFEFANPAYLELIGNRNPIGKTVLEALPEIVGQGFNELLDKVYNTGETFIGKEMPIKLDKGSEKYEQFFLNFTYQALLNDQGKTDGILVFAYDVTEQLMARKQIEASEKRFSNILSQSLMAIAIFKGPDMVIAFANEPMLNVLGKGNTVLNKPLVEGVPELIGQVFPQLLAEVYATGVAFEGFEIKATLVRNGIPVNAYFNFVYQPYRDVDDTITGITVLATEVTEEVLAKKLVEASEKRFSNILEQSIMGVAIFKGSEMRIAFANEPMIAILRKGKEIIGKALLEALPELEGQPFPKLLDDVFTTGVPYYGYETKAILERNGQAEETYFNFVYQPYREVDNSITGITVLVTEVGQQVNAKKQIEESENRFRIFADSIQNLAWIANGDGMIFWYNQRWYDYTGTTLEEMQGSGWQKVHHPNKIEKVIEFLKEAWKKGEAFELTFQLRRADGEYHWFLTRAYPVKDIQGSIERWIGTNTDITQQKMFTEELEMKVKERTEQLQQKILRLNVPMLNSTHSVMLPATI